MSNQDRINVYVCKTCGGMICTIDRDEGTTPFMIDCRATRNCGGVMESQWYPVVSPSFAPTHEFYKPKRTKHMDDATKDHVSRGGLLLRKIEPNRQREMARWRIDEWRHEL